MYQIIIKAKNYCPKYIYTVTLPPLVKLIGRNKTKQRAVRALLKSHLWGLSRVTLNSNSQVLSKVSVHNVATYLKAALG